MCKTLCEVEKGFGKKQDSTLLLLSRREMSENAQGRGKTLADTGDGIARGKLLKDTGFAEKWVSNVLMGSEKNGDSISVCRHS